MEADKLQNNLMRLRHAGKEDVDLLSRALKLLTQAGKGVVNECLVGEADGEEAKSASQQGIEEEAKRMLSELDDAMSSGSEAMADALLQAKVLKELEGKGARWFCHLDDGVSEGCGTVSEAVAAGKTLRAVNDAAAFVERTVAEKRPREQAAILARDPLRGIIADYQYEVQGQAREIDDDIAEVRTKRSLICEITRVQMVDPVLTPCGHTFSRAALKSLHAQTKKCPTCNTPFMWRQVVIDREMAALLRRAKRRRVA